MKLLSSKRFERNLKKYLAKYPIERHRILDVLNILVENPFLPALKTHKLKGNLGIYLSCSCGFDCRIIFSIEKSKDFEDYILLIDIGTHKDVY